MLGVEERLRELGLELSPVPKPVAEYVPAKRVGDLVYVSGQGPIRDGKPVYVGREGAEVSPEDAYKAAQLCALNCLAAVKSLVDSLDAVEEEVMQRAEYGIVCLSFASGWALDVCGEERLAV
ncbi:MAG TPA: RidA family protein [Candidatus Bipolaricaulis anaerobius]|nr:RidA family protein [Candidatus Bipolaricaulis anaerobius]HNS23700.1 RidA family protein [Candidatus Bipolaricaulis anaerobius]